MTLLIVESPTKAKTIGKMLHSREYAVASSYGHIRDLPTHSMGIDLEHDFAPKYVISKDKQKTVNELKTLAHKARRVILATDEDREGEAIAWHLVEALGLNEERGAGSREQHAVDRIVFHEITKEAIERALESPRGIDHHLVDAQQARRIIDRLVGYELSPFLWRKVARGLSAGRVQSAALRMIVERERERAAFVSQEYWTIIATLVANNKEMFEAELVSLDGKTLTKFAIPTAERAKEIIAWLTPARTTVESVEQKRAARSPLPPFTTSTLQQEANRRLGFSAKQTMMLAQQLYEGIEIGEEDATGLITYMRTDAATLAKKFLDDAAALIANAYGPQYTRGARHYKTTSKLAQEAHEAIRPTEAARTPEQLKGALEARQWKLYDLIWRRAMASQMTDAQFDTTTIRVTARGRQHDGELAAKGLVMVFDGFTRLWPVETQLNAIPTLRKGRELDITQWNPKQHFTQPPARFSDATLVKALEEHGIGRPSTYAPTIATIIERLYVDRDEEKRLFPTEIGTLVVDVLSKHFPTIVDYSFTARLEDSFDTIAQGGADWQPLVREFYEPFHALLIVKEQEVSKKELTEQATNEACEKCGRSMVIKIGRFGKFLACSGYPECKNTKSIEAPPNGNQQQKNDTSMEQIPPCEKCGKPMQLKRGRFGEFLGCSGYPECKNIKSLARSTGVACPSCNKGSIVERKSKRGRIFFSCDHYPQCTFALWNKPAVNPETKQPITCPTCGALVTYAAKGKLKCSKKECGYSADGEAVDARVVANAAKI